MVKWGELETLEICAVKMILKMSLMGMVFESEAWAMWIGKPSSEFMAQVP